jgi:ATP-dependent Clp protease ATP-binding subunit ClpC
MDTTTTGFNPTLYLEKVTFNLYSRLIGAMARTVLIFVDLISVILILFGGAIGLLIWIMLPFLSFSFYKKYRKNPSYLVQKLREKINHKDITSKDIFENEAGNFVLSHIGLSLEDLKDARTQKFKIDRRADRFKEIIESYIKNTPNLEVLLNSKSLQKRDLIWSSEWWDKKRKKESQDEMLFGKPGIGLELLFGYTPELNKVTKDLSTRQAFTSHLIGRGQVLQRMERVLASGKSVILRGVAGVGKKTVILEFAYKASLGQLGHQMAYQRILDFDVNAILSQSVDLNQKKIRLQNILQEGCDAGNIILVIHDIERLTNANVEGYDFTSIFEGVLSKKELRIIASVSDEEYERFIAPNIRLTKYFEGVIVSPPTKDEAMSILTEEAENWERKRRITILVPALRQIVEGADRYITETPFPEKALEILDEVVMSIDGRKILTVDDVNKLLEIKTGIPFARLNEEEKSKLGDLENIIHESLVNQDTAVKLIAKSLRARETGIKDENRPIGSFLFLGPTGVGKTETARVLAEVYYGNEKNILRFDMAEYNSSDGLDRLIGSVSRNQPGALTTAIKNKPASLLLLDEIEKAPSEIKNLFLTLLEDGFITDAFGKKINCQNLMVIATSNAGAEDIRQLVSNGIRGEDLQTQVIDLVQKKKLFSPEFLNRFDGIVVYEPLTEENLQLIAELMLKSLKEKLSHRNIYLEYKQETIKKLATEGYDPRYGARPMRRIVDLNIGDLIGSGILNGKVKDGDKIILLPGPSKNEYKILS